MKPRLPRGEPTMAPPMGPGMAASTPEGPGGYNFDADAHSPGDGYHHDRSSHKFIDSAIKHPGALHKALGVPEDKKIPRAKLAVKKDDSTLMKERKNLAKTLGKFHR